MRLHAKAIALTTGAAHENHRLGDVAGKCRLGGYRNDPAIGGHNKRIDGAIIQVYKAAGIWCRGGRGRWIMTPNSDTFDRNRSQNQNKNGRDTTQSHFALLRLDTIQPNGIIQICRRQNKGPQTADKRLTKSVGTGATGRPCSILILIAASGMRGLRGMAGSLPQTEGGSATANGMVYRPLR